MLSCQFCSSGAATSPAQAMMMFSAGAEGACLGCLLSAGDHLWRKGQKPLVLLGLLRFLGRAQADTGLHCCSCECMRSPTWSACDQGLEWPRLCCFCCKQIRPPAGAVVVELRLGVPIRSLLDFLP